MGPEAGVRPEFAQRKPHAVASSAGANVALIAAAALMLALQLAGLPLLLNLPACPAPLALLALVPIVAATPIHWGLIHEGIHGHLLPSRRANEWVSRALAIGIALPFDSMRFGHLMHHRFTREPYDRPDVDDSPRPGTRKRIAYYVRLLGGLYLAEVLVPSVAFLPASLASRIVADHVGAAGPVGPQVQRLFSHHAADPARRRRARRDWLISLALHVGSLHLYGAWWPVLVASLYLRGLWLSVADNLPHYGVALDEPGRARDFRVPRGLGVLLMNHHLHRQHHLHPTLPWTALPQLARAEPAEAQSMRPGYFGSALRQFRGIRRGCGPH